MAKAYDAAGNTQSSSVISATVSNPVPDTTPPVLTLPSNMTVEAANSSGAVVTYTATAIDAKDGSRPVTCSPSSGSTFQITTTTVNCSASDLSGNTANGSFMVTVQDTTAPSVSITSPTNGSNVSGTTTVSANASDGVGVSYVDFFMGTTNVGRDTLSPYELDLDTSQYPDGQHQLKATATDGRGNKADSMINVTVEHTAPGGGSPPTIAIIEPSKNSPISGTVTIKMSVYDLDGTISKVEVRIDGTLIATLPGGASSTYLLNWDTTTVVNGSRVITGTAYDDSGNSSESSKTVKVNNNGGSSGGKGDGPKK